MDLFDFVWPCMAKLCDSVLLWMILYDATQCFITLYYYVRLCFDFYESFWLFMTLFDSSVLSYVTLFYSGWLYMILSNALWHCMTMFASTRLLYTVCLCTALYASKLLCWNQFRWLSLPLFDCLWLYLILFCSVGLCLFGFDST